MKTENTLAVETLSKWIISTCQKLIDKAKFDKTYEGVVSAVNSDGYVVGYAGTRITIKTKALNFYSVGEKVKICIPQGNKRKAFIVADLYAVSKVI